MMDRGGSAAPPCQAAVGDAEREKRNTRTSHPMFLSDDGRRCVGPPGGPGPLWSAKNFTEIQLDPLGRQRDDLQSQRDDPLRQAASRGRRRVCALPLLVGGVGRPVVVWA